MTTEKGMKKAKLNISKEPRCHDLESIGSIVMPMIKGVMSAEDLVAADVMLNWGGIIGSEIASFCNPLKVKYNPRENCRILYVEVPIGGFALEMQHRENYILEKINSYFGYRAVHKLNISQSASMQPRGIFPQLQEKKKKAELTADDEKYLLELVEGITDEKLKEILIKLGKSVIQSQRGEE